MESIIILKHGISVIFKASCLVENVSSPIWEDDIFWQEASSHTGFMLLQYVYVIPEWKCLPGLLTVLCPSVFSVRSEVSCLWIVIFRCSFGPKAQTIWEMGNKPEIVFNENKQLLAEYAEHSFSKLLFIPHRLSLKALSFFYLQALLYITDWEESWFLCVVWVALLGRRTYKSSGGVDFFVPPR